MRTLLSILTVALLGSLIGCGGPSEADKINKEIDALDLKMGAINRQFTDMNERVKEADKLKGEFDALDQRIASVAADQQEALRSRLNNVKARITRKE